MTYPDGILRQVTKPARYTGGEWNCVIKDWGSTAIRFALCYPDIYEIGMSNMAVPILYDILNRQPDVLAERVYAPWGDMEAALRRSGNPLLSLESKRPLRDFDVIGFSLDYELTYTNVLNILDLAGIPVLAAERGDAHPLVIAGGSSCLNPEPMADFLDFCVLGDGEEVVLELLDYLREGKGGSKPERLRRAAAIPGVYVPSLYQVDYQGDGLFRGITPLAPEAKPVIRRRLVSTLPPPVTRPVVPYIEVVHDRGAVEIQRGCTRGCRFCQAGNIYRPVRPRPREEILQAVGEIIGNCGYNEISLVSLSSADYPGIAELVRDIAESYPGLSLSLPSLRIDSFSVELMESLPARGKTGLTFAPEAGSERLRRCINKNVPEEQIVDTAAAAFGRGWTGLKLYFMLGLPGETSEDVEAITRLVGRIRAAGRAVRATPRLRISLSTFVPKAHTPFQWVAQETESSLNGKHEQVKGGLRQKGISISWSDPRVSLLEAVLSRGDRRLGQVIYGAWKLGSKFDAWDECFNFDNWQRAFSQAGLEPDFYARRERPLDEPLPWGHIDAGVSPDFLKREYLRANSGEDTADCRSDTCNTCGLQRLDDGCRQRLGA